MSSNKFEVQGQPNPFLQPRVLIRQGGGGVKHQQLCKSLSMEQSIDQVVLAAVAQDDTAIYDVAASGRQAEQSC